MSSLLIGEVFAAIKPDTDGFADELRTQLAAVHVDYDVHIVLDLGDITTQLATLKAQIDDITRSRDITIRATVDLNDTLARTRLDRLQDRFVVDGRVELDTLGAEAQLAALRAQGTGLSTASSAAAPAGSTAASAAAGVLAGGTLAEVPQVLRDIGTESARSTPDLRRFTDELEKLLLNANKSSKIKFPQITSMANLNNVIAADDALNEWRASFSASSLVPPTKKKSSGGGSGGGDSGPFAGILPGGVRAGPGAIGGAAALGAGAGAGIALASIPVAFGAIGAYAEHADVQVTQSFGNMERVAKDSLATGFKPFIPTLVAIADQGKQAFTALEPIFRQAATVVSPQIASISSGFITATQTGVTDLASNLNRLVPVANALGDDFVKLEQGVAGFFANINTSAAAEGLSQLGNLVQTLLPEVGSLVSSLAPLANSVTEVANAILAVLSPALRGLSNLLNVPGIAQAVTGAGALAIAYKLLSNNGIVFTQSLRDQKTATAATELEMAKLNVTVKESALLTAKDNSEKATTLAVTDASAVATGKAAAAKLAEMTAGKELAIANAAVTVSEETATAAAKGFWASLGPIDWAVLGITAAVSALSLFSSSANDASQATQQLTTDIKAVEAAAGDVSATAQLTDAQKNLASTYTAAGIGANTLKEANAGSVPAMEQVTAATKKQLEASQAKLAADKAASPALSSKPPSIAAPGFAVTPRQTVAQTDSINADTDAVGKNKAAYDAANAQLIQYQQAEAATAAITIDLSDTNARLAVTAQQAAQRTAEQTAATNALGAGLSQAQAGVQAYWAGIEQTNTAFATAIAPAETMLKNLQSLASAENQVATAQDQAAASSISLANAQDTLQQAQDPNIGVVAQANWNIAQATDGVASAQHSLADSNLTVAKDTIALTKARQDAIITLKDLTNATADQADAQASSRLKLIDAQNAVNALGLEHTNLQVSDITIAGKVTGANEEQYKAILALQDAKNNLNDTTAAGTKLAQTNAVAQAAGAAPQSVLDAQKTLNDAIYNQSQQQDAVASAQHNLLLQQPDLHNANKQLAADSQSVKTATDNVKTSTQEYTASALTLVDAYIAANQQATPTEDGFKAVGKAAGIPDAILTSIGDSIFGTGGKQAIAGANANFSIVGQPSLNLTQLITQAQAMGIDPRGLGFTPDQIQAVQTTGSDAATHFKAGGPIPGSGSGTVDSVPIMAAPGEHMWTAEEVTKAGGHGAMESMRSAVRGYARGGPIGEATGGAISSGQSLINSVAKDPYVWGAVGPNAFDCSGLVGDVYADLLGLPLNKRYFVTQSDFAALGFKPGHGAFTIGVNPATHMAGNLAGLGFEARSTRDGIKVGGAAQSVDAFQQQWFLPDVGGVFTPSGSDGAALGGAYAAGGFGAGRSVADARALLGVNVKLATMQAFGQGIANTLTAFGQTPKSQLPFAAAPPSGQVAPQIPINFGAFAPGSPGGDPGVSLGAIGSVGDINTPAGFAAALLTALNAPQSAANLNSLETWEAREGGNWHNTAHYNPLNTTLFEPGSTSMNSVGVKSYTGWQQGLQATVDTLNGYGAIETALRAGTGLKVPGVAADLLKWSGGGYGSLDQGGWLPPPINATGRKEAVLNPDESLGLIAAVRGNKETRLDSFTINRLAQAYVLAIKAMQADGSLQLKPSNGLGVLV